MAAVGRGRARGSRARSCGRVRTPRPRRRRHSPTQTPSEGRGRAGGARSLLHRLPPARARPPLCGPDHSAHAAPLPWRPEPRDVSLRQAALGERSQRGKESAAAAVAWGPRGGLVPSPPAQPRPGQHGLHLPPRRPPESTPAVI